MIIKNNIKSYEKSLEGNSFFLMLMLEIGKVLKSMISISTLRKLEKRSELKSPPKKVQEKIIKSRNQ